MRGAVSASLKGNFGSRRTGDLRFATAWRTSASDQSRNRVRTVFELEFSVAPSKSAARVPGWPKPVPQRTETRLFTGYLIAWASRRVLRLIIGRRPVPSRLVPAYNVVCQSARSGTAPSGACAPHQTSSRDYANTIVSYPARSVGRRRISTRTFDELCG